MAEVLAFPVIEAEQVSDASILELGLSLMRAIRAGDVTAMVLVTVHDSDQSIKTRWVNGADDRFDILNAVSALQHDLLQQRIEDGRN